MRPTQPHATTDVISQVCQHPGPFLTAYLDVSRNVDEAPHRLAVRWRSAREQLQRMAAPSELIDLAEERITEPVDMPGSTARMVVAADNDIVLDDVVPRPRSNETVTWGPLPDLTGWLADRSTAVPILVVLADREGADFELYAPWPERLVTHDSADGDTKHLTKVAVGGWSHKRYQRRAEETWRRNAEQVAAEIDELITTGVRAVVTAGDLRAQGEIRQAVSEPARAALVELETGGRAAGSSRTVLDDAIDEVVREAVDSDRRRVLNELEEEAGRDGAAVLGVDGVLPALVQGRVRTAVLAPEVASGTVVEPAAHPGLPLPAAAREAGPVRADLAVLCASAATDAETVVTGRPISADGVAAVLRW
ncbi:Vms1/Ankzf1 family peptidyl-tRNA hydrolase [Phytoactinopolyspora limicola]|uniref:baeRF2 domain-containing protein n=1 Tax=Phytoactinopolyspora limicola TaxID=2715536 RepID=UPI00140D9ABF|nr:Vms1/Ankzf1 family peptidyl-tRNA hydrolase [Phytoactinopolyspora limicola]